MKIKLFFVNLFVLLPLLFYPQNKPEFVVKLENKAAKHYNMGDYLLALHYYQKLYEVDSTNLNYISNLAYSYVDGERNIKEAIRLLNKYKEKGGTLDNEFYFHLGKAYMFDFKIEKALDAFNKFKPAVEKGKKDIKYEKYMAKEILRLKEMCHNANNLLSHPVRVKFENLGPNVNSSHDDYLPFLIDSGRHLLFTSNKYYDQLYEVFTQNIYQSQKDANNKWTFAKPMKKLNSEDNEELVSVTSDGKTMFVRSNFYEDFSTILVAIRKGKTFKYPPENHIQEAINPKMFYMGASYCAATKTLYVSYGEKSSSNLDIYTIKELPDGTWSKPEKLPPEINTIYNEAYPIINATDDTLYFASKGHNSMGGYDIFYSVRRNGKWGRAINLGYPVNSTFDDYSIAFGSYHKYAYIAANRSEGYGGKDIYKITFEDRDGPLILIKGFVFVKEKDQEVEFKDHPEDFNVLVKNKSGDVVAKYMLQKGKNKFIAILPPGEYNFIMSNEGFKEKDFKLTLSEDKKFIVKKITIERL
jgi:tetratricopeptide (TPR) repeat protein